MVTFGTPFEEILGLRGCLVNIGPESLGISVLGVEMVK